MIIKFFEAKLNVIVFPRNPNTQMEDTYVDKKRGERRAGTVVWQFPKKWSTQRQPTPAWCLNGLHTLELLERGQEQGRSERHCNQSSCVFWGASQYLLQLPPLQLINAMREATAIGSVIFLNVEPIPLSAPLPHALLKVRPVLTETTKPPIMSVYWVPKRRRLPHACAFCASCGRGSCSWSIS